MSKHTPGPWDIVAGGLWVHEERTGGSIAMLSEDEGDIDQTPRSKSEVRANGLLIAAAPELYEALKALTTHIDGSGFADRLPVYKNAMAALAKAEGKVSR